MAKAKNSIKNESHEGSYLLNTSFERKQTHGGSQSIPFIDKEEKDEENPDISIILATSEDKDDASTGYILRNELKQMVILSIPVTGTFLLEMLPGIFSIILVGHVDSELTKEYIDATSLATMLLNISSLSVGFGLASAMDTLCSQAFGANETHRIGTYFQTGLIVLSVAFFFVFWANFYAKDILVLLGQPVLVSEFAGTYARIQMIGIPFLYVYELLKRILLAQNIASPMVIISAISNFINISLGYYLINHTSSGWLGAAIARTVSNMSFAILLIIYLHISEHYKTFWSSWNLKDALGGLRQWVILGIPGMFQLCFEWWAFEVLAIISGLLPNPVVAIGANSILLNISTLSYMFFLGISVSGNVRVGNALGAGCPRRANLASRLVLSFGLIVSLFCASFLLTFRTSLPKLFTNDTELVEYSSKLLYIAAVFQIADSVGASVQGILRGSGRQSLGANMCFVAYFIIGIPLGSFWAFHYNLSVFGLWCGMTVGIFLFSICGSFFILKTDWIRMVEEAKDRI